MDNAAKRNKRGRPRKLKLGSIMLKAVLPRPKSGRPIEIVNDSKKRLLHEWELKKAKIAKRKGKKSVTDKEALDYMKENEWKNLPPQEKITRHKLGRSKIKNFRDETSIRQKPKKRKTPPKKT